MTKFAPKRIKISIIPLIIAGMFTFSCTEDFEILTNDSPPVVVIYGVLSNLTDYHYINISSSASYFDTVPNVGISGANVKITSSGNETFNFVEIDTIPGKYISTDKIAGTPGIEYTLDVTLDFNGKRETYSAKSTMLHSVQVDSIDVHYMKLLGRELYSLSLYAQDPPSEDFYLMRCKLNDSLILFKKITHLMVMDDIGFNGQYMNGLFLRGFASIKDKERHEKEDAERGRVSERVYISLGDTVSLSLSRIEQGYFNFIMQCRQERNGENPFFGGPPSNIVTNISGKATGYFACYAFSEEKSTVVTEE